VNKVNMASPEIRSPEEFDQKAAASRALSLLRDYKDEISDSPEPDDKIEVKGRPGWFYSVLGLCGMVIEEKFFLGRPLGLEIQRFIDKFDNGNGGGFSSQHIYTQEEIGEANTLLAKIAHYEDLKKI
jgi:hypothetical protein